MRPSASRSVDDTVGAFETDHRALPFGGARAGRLLAPRADRYQLENPSAGPEHHAFMARSIIEKFLKVADTVRHAREIRVDADRHDPRDVGAFGVQPVELALTALEHLVRGVQRHRR